MHIKKLSLCAVICLFSVPDFLFAQQPAYDYNSGVAANIPTTKPSAPAVLPKAQFTNWSSGYLGVNAGFGQTNYKISDAAHLRGAVTSLGLFSGLNLQSAALVYGVAADVALPFATKKNEKMVARRRFDSSLRGKLGLDMGNFMPYGTLGLASDYISFAANDATKKSTGRFRLGYVWGAGADIKLISNFIGEIECKKSTFSQKSYRLLGENFSSGLANYSLRLGVATKF